MSGPMLLPLPITWSLGECLGEGGRGKERGRVGGRVGGREKEWMMEGGKWREGERTACRGKQDIP